MKITRIFAHRVELPLREGSYKWAGGKAVSVFDSTIVGVGSARAVEIESADGCGAEGASLCEERDRHGVLGYSRAGGRGCGVRADGGTVWRECAALPGDLAGVAGGDGRESGGLSGGGVYAVSTESGRRGGHRHRADSGGSRRAERGGAAGGG